MNHEKIHWADSGSEVGFGFIHPNMYWIMKNGSCIQIFKEAHLAGDCTSLFDWKKLDTKNYWFQIYLGPQKVLVQKNLDKKVLVN